jgi:hypothetical protein
LEVLEGFEVVLLDHRVVFKLDFVQMHFKTGGGSSAAIFKSGGEKDGAVGAGGFIPDSPAIVLKAEGAEMPPVGDIGGELDGVAVFVVEDGLPMLNGRFQKFFV